MGTKILRDELGELNFTMERDILSDRDHKVMNRKSYEKAKKTKGCMKKAIALRCIFHTLIHKEKSCFRLQSFNKEPSFVPAIFLYLSE